ncbi:glycerophosphodiester phosphodiesterase [Muricoccus roseus]|uniref:glycerophosphodiester phosphodiesterase n=1 Tax=Muricoccus roseus TaxID=198092 RepID=UPI000933EB0E|nr:glycerophosphodiester phosphodiesterase family protein [Roseomonas rosea]
MGGSSRELSASATASQSFTVPPSRIFAHRGFGTNGAPNALSPENTLAAFRRAASLGVAGLETDIQATRDGVPVLMHDATVDRTTDGEGAVRELSAAQIASLNAAGRFGPGAPAEPVPSLASYFALCRELGMVALPELKAARRPEEVARILTLAEEAGMADRVVWSSRRLRTLEIVAEMRGGRSRLALIRNDLRDFGTFLQLPGEKMLLLRATALLQGRVEAKEVTGAGVSLAAWTVNQSEVARRLIDGGCDFILADGPV